MLRENLFDSKETAGVNIRAQDNEKSFIITPMIDLKPVKVETDLNTYMK